MLAVSTIIVIGGLILAVVLLNGPRPVCQFPEGFEVPDPPPDNVDEGGIPADTLVTSLEWVVDPSKEKKYQRLVKVDTANPHQIEVLGPTGAGATISPDRRQVSYLTVYGGAREPHIWNVDSGEEEAWRRDEVCKTTQRVSWSQSGTQVATLCTDVATGDAIKGVFVFDVASQDMAELPTPGIPDDRSGPTWVGDDAIIYGQKESEKGAVTLWLFPSVSSKEEPVQITDGVDGGTTDTNPDWSPYDGGNLMFLRSSLDATSGAIWTCSPEKDGGQWGSEELFLAPTWSPDGTGLAFLIKNDDEPPVLAWADFDSDLQHAQELSEEPEVVGDQSQVFDVLKLDLTEATRTPPAWGSR